MVSSYQVTYAIGLLDQGNESATALRDFRGVQALSRKAGRSLPPSTKRAIGGAQSCRSWQVAALFGMLLPDFWFRNVHCRVSAVSGGPARARCCGVRLTTPLHVTA